MSVARDPETGEFVSVDETDLGRWDEMVQVSGGLGVEIPAADLAGGTTDHDPLEGDEVQIMNFTEVLTQGEVLVATHIEWEAWAAAHTTFSGQTFGVVTGQISRDSEMSPGFQSSPPFWTTAVEEGVYDINQAGAGDGGRSENVIHEFNLATTGQILNGTSNAAGGDIGVDQGQIPFLAVAEAGPQFDADDELYCPVQFLTDAFSDGALEFYMKAKVRGFVFET